MVIIISIKVKKYSLVHNGPCKLFRMLYFGQTISSSKNSPEKYVLMESNALIAFIEIFQRFIFPLSGINWKS